MNKKVTKTKIETEYITLGQFLKLVDVIYSGGEAKSYLATHEVKINNEVDQRRGRKLRHNDVIEVEGKIFQID